MPGLPALTLSHAQAPVAVAAGARGQARAGPAQLLLEQSRAEPREVLAGDSRLCVQAVDLQEVLGAQAGLGNTAGVSTSWAGHRGPGVAPAGLGGAATTLLTVSHTWLPLSMWSGSVALSRSHLGACGSRGSVYSAWSCPV